jgi:hypothetical protein
MRSGKIGSSKIGSSIPSSTEVTVLPALWAILLTHVLLIKQRIAMRRAPRSRMLTYADVCWRMLTSADVCWLLLTYEKSASLPFCYDVRSELLCIHRICVWRYQILCIVSIVLVCVEILLIRYIVSAIVTDRYSGCYDTYGRIRQHASAYVSIRQQ